MRHELVNCIPDMVHPIQLSFLLSFLVAAIFIVQPSNSQITVWGYTHFDVNTKWHKKLHHFPNIGKTWYMQYEIYIWARIWHDRMNVIAMETSYIKSRFTRGNFHVEFPGAQGVNYPAVKDQIKRWIRVTIWR